MGVQIEFIGIHRASPTINNTQKVYIDNHRFIPKHNNNSILKYSIQIGLHSDVYEYDGWKEYRTIFGPSFAHNGVWSRNDRVSLAGAIKRLTNVRVPETPGYHELLKQNQFQNVRTQSHYDYITRFQNLLRRIQVESSEVGQQIWANQPHPKKAMRINTLKSIHANGRIAHPD